MAFVRVLVPRSGAPQAAPASRPSAALAFDPGWGSRSLQLAQRLALVHGSPAAQAQRLRTQRLLGTRPPAQLKLQVSDNPYLEHRKVQTPKAGKQAVADAAKAIDIGTENGIAIVNQVLDGYSKGKLTSDQIQQQLPDTGHTTNFVNKIIDWGNKKSVGSQIAATAGYVIEDFALATMPANAQSQFASGGARPDFMVSTKEQWNPGKLRAADGFVDVTSQAEAAKGHLKEKVTRMSEDKAFNYPHLYDSYYAAVVVPGAVVKSPAEMSGTAYKARMAELARRVERAEQRRQSLRSHKALAPKKLIKKPPHVAKAKHKSKHR